MGNKSNFGWNYRQNLSNFGTPLIWWSMFAKNKICETFQCEVHSQQQLLLNATTKLDTNLQGKLGIKTGHLCFIQCGGGAMSDKFDRFFFLHGFVCC